MKKTHRAILLTTMLTLILYTGWVERGSNGEAQLKNMIEARDRWIDILVQCESSGNQKAINQNDSDGTPSYGLLQFKPSTFEMFSKKYQVKGDLMDPVAQRRIVERMTMDEKVKFKNQFPACVKKLGLPPQVRF